CISSRWVRIGDDSGDRGSAKARRGTGSTELYCFVSRCQHGRAAVIASKRELSNLLTVLSGLLRRVAPRADEIGVRLLSPPAKSIYTSSSSHSPQNLFKETKCPKRTRWQDRPVRRRCWQTFRGW